MTLPEEDKQHVFKSKLLDEITMMLGGRVAEALTLKDVSTGAISDLQRATETAKDMVTKYGMSDELGPIFLASGHEVFLGKDFGQTPEYSETTAAKIDSEVSRIVEGAYQRATEILGKNLHKLVSIGEMLMRREKLTGEEFKALFEDEISEEGLEAMEAKKEKNAGEKEPEKIAPLPEPELADAEETIIVEPPKPEEE